MVGFEAEKYRLFPMLMLPPVLSEPTPSPPDFTWLSAPTLIGAGTFPLGGHGCVVQVPPYGGPAQA